MSAGHIWETSTTWNATPGEDGGWYGSKPPESLCSGEPDYPHAVMRARIESLLPGVHDTPAAAGRPRRGQPHTSPADARCRIRPILRLSGRRWELSWQLEQDRGGRAVSKYLNWMFARKAHAIARTWDLLRYLAESLLGLGAAQRVLEHQGDMEAGQ